MQDRWTNVTDSRTLSPSAIDEGSGVRELSLSLDDPDDTTTLLRSIESPCHPDHDLPGQDNAICPRTLNFDPPFSLDTGQLPDGRSTFTVDASDLADNTAADGGTATAFSIYLDRRAPTSSVSGALFDAADSWVRPAGPGQLTVTGTDTAGGEGRTSGIAHNQLTAVDRQGTTVLTRDADTCTPPGPIAAPCDPGKATTFTVNPQQLPEGPITFSAASRDLAGNDSQPVTWTVRLDRTPPAARASGDLLALTSQHTNTTTPTSVTLQGRDAASGVARLQLVASNSNGEKILADRDTCTAGDVDPTDGACPHNPSVDGHHRPRRPARRADDVHRPRHRPRRHPLRRQPGLGHLRRPHAARPARQRQHQPDQQHQRPDHLADRRRPAAGLGQRQLRVPHHRRRPTDRRLAADDQPARPSQRPAARRDHQRAGARRGRCRQHRPAGRGRAQLRVRGIGPIEAGSGAATCGVTAATIIQHGWSSLLDSIWAPGGRMAAGATITCLYTAPDDVHAKVSWPEVRGNVCLQRLNANNRWIAFGICTPYRRRNPKVRSNKVGKLRFYEATIPVAEISKCTVHSQGDARFRTRIHVHARKRVTAPGVVIPTMGNVSTSMSRPTSSDSIAQPSSRAGIASQPPTLHAPGRNSTARPTRSFDLSSATEEAVTPDPRTTTVTVAGGKRITSSRPVRREPIRRVSPASAVTSIQMPRSTGSGCAAYPAPMARPAPSNSGPPISSACGIAGRPPTTTTTASTQ